MMIRVLPQAWCLRGREQEKTSEREPEGETERGTLLRAFPGIRGRGIMKTETR